MKVVFFHRRPRPNINFSVENLFQQVRANLPAGVEWEVVVLRFFSKGFFKRVYISLEAAFNQKGINHVTGDVNFITLFLRKRKTVLTMLDLGLMNHPNKFARAILKMFWVTLPVRRAAAVTTISHATKTELLRYVPVDPNKIKVVYVPISNLFIPVPKKFNKVMPTLLQIGTKPNKNISRLARALRGLHCKLQIIGLLNDELKQELAVNDINYTASANLSNEEIVRQYQHADIITFVSTYEGFGMPIVEANATGRVVITSNVLSMPEIASDAAHLVDPYDINSIREGVIRVIEDDEYRDRLIINGYKNCQRFDVKAIAGRYAEIYRSLSN